MEVKWVLEEGYAWFGKLEMENLSKYDKISGYSTWVVSLGCFSKRVSKVLRVKQNRPKNKITRSTNKK